MRADQSSGQKEPKRISSPETPTFHRFGIFYRNKPDNKILLNGCSDKTY